MDSYSLEAQAAASIVVALGGKRDRSGDDSPDAAAGGLKGTKFARVEAPEAPQPMGPAPAVEPEAEELQPFPFFYYKDFSTTADPDPLSPLTPPGRVPNFPAKMHAILSRPDLADIVAWMPHGRSWRVLKPREFEIKVIPTYFEHAKFSSFIRQANGWGFRRVTQGRDRNSYYHELFLRGLPHLCKEMKRPGVAQKQAADPDHEPDFYKISDIHPVPEKAEDDSILLDCTLRGGPKARMPIYSGALNTAKFSDFMPKTEAKVPAAAPTLLTPRDQQTIGAFQQALGASENKNANVTPITHAPSLVALPQASFLPTAPTTAVAKAPQPADTVTTSQLTALMAANHLAFGGIPSLNTSMAAFQANSAASQFAAGFAAATALSQQQFRSMLGSMAVAPATQPPNPTTPANQP